MLVLEKTQSEATYWRDEAISFLGLSSLKGVGYWTLYKIAASGGSFAAILREVDLAKVERELRTKVALNSQHWMEQQKSVWEVGVSSLKMLVRSGVNLLFRGKGDLPPSLASIDDGPMWLFVQGDLQNLFSRSVAIVGTRKPSADGIFLARYLVALIADWGIPTVSGIAQGIDQVVHEESLRYGIPTVAVLGTGIYDNYPKGSEEMRTHILENGGTVISEYLPNQRYSAENFVRRNRIQAALCETLFPVEWAIKSGTAHTVEFAHRYGRRIVNTFLPGTYELRPELSFSLAQYSADSYQVPAETERLVSALLGRPEVGKPASEVVQLTLEI